MTISTKTSSRKTLRGTHGLILLALCVLAWPTPGRADDGKILLLPGSHLQLFGDSTFHKFSSEATRIDFTGQLERADGAAQNGLRVNAQGLTFIIPVAGLNSGDSTLDEHMAEAFKAAKFPEIRGTLKSYEARTGPDDSHIVNTSIELTVAGQTKTLPVTATVVVTGEEVRIKGEKQLLMSDFGIDPPTMMLGVVKTADEIVVRFDLKLKANLNANQRKN